ncbi:MAG: 5-(carboxyamino)imidazole ribonucleotide synthase [Synechococcaceae cyanobacterium SM2_3_2]|nr:5-(carboxyamino)imidazole ribonucleotide synthase [Synechococcaceae cyanobacterium SM2_3_2]
MLKRVGVIGGGQLAQMLAKAAAALDIELWIQTPYASDPAVSLAAHTLLAPIDDLEVTRQMAERVEVITFENEFVDLDRLQTLADQGILFAPQLGSLSPLLDKLDQRHLLQSLGIGTPQFWPIRGTSYDDWIQSLPWMPTVERPLVVKIRRGGYDGQGTFVVKSAQALNESFQTIEQSLAPDQDRDRVLLAEEWIPFERELAIMAARASSGEIRLFPVVETQQVQQVCRRVFAPARISSRVQAQVESIATTLLKGLAVVGILGIELFLTTDEKVRVNEIAPRTHNSAHLSLDACQTSQFEQHLRAITNRPLGDPSLTVPGAVMINLLGTDEGSTDRYAAQLEAIARIPNAHLHWYGKAESRLGRKLGHVTVLDPNGSPNQSLDELSSRERLLALARPIETLWYGSELGS